MELCSYDWDSSQAERFDKNGNVVPHHGKWYGVTGEYGGGFTTLREAMQCARHGAKAYREEDADKDEYLKRDAPSVYLMDTRGDKSSMITII